ncbi:hypothetical protein K501DRAFT_268422 [Backusella circina FSU 941]|nr:hypothetical protein K501DRAFT_268422 [Backusella circina FSU 941]
MQMITDTNILRDLANIFMEYKGIFDNSDDYTAIFLPSCVSCPSYILDTASTANSNRIVKVHVSDCIVSVGTLIKQEALLLRQGYHSFDVQGKAIVSLGLNSIIDLSFNHPEAQATFFGRHQWRRLRYSSKKYSIDTYISLLEPLDSICKIENNSKNFTRISLISFFYLSVSSTDTTKLAVTWT